MGLAREHAEALGAWGWSSARTDALEAGVAGLEDRAATQAEARDQARGASEGETTARTNAKSLIRRLRLAAPLALRDVPGTGVTLEAFEAGGPLGRSTARISDYMVRIRPAVAALDEALRPYFNGERASAALAAVKAELDAADRVQEVSVSKPAAQTVALYEAKGRVLGMIEDLNRVARIAFDGRAEIAARFNKDILLRARRRRPDPAPAAAE